MGAARHHMAAHRRETARVTMESMRILWATPYNVKSAIARYSQIVVRALAARDHSVEILRLEDEAAAKFDVLDSDLRIHEPGTLDLTRLRDVYDVCVINYGNYLSYHADALTLAATTPAVAVLHDADMEHFFFGARHAYPRLGGLLECWPPNALALPQRRTPAEEATSFLAALAAGCVVHGHHYVDDVVAACPGPTARLSLCYPDIGTLPPAPDDSGAFVVVCFGMINPNKQPERILRALAHDQDLRARARVRFIGPIEAAYRARLTALAVELGLAAPDFTGWVDDSQLCALIAQAHLLCCLRHPVSEGGSASVITALYASRPTVVNNAGSYAEIPDGLVRKIEASDDPAPLATVMSEIARSPQAAETAAVQAAAYAHMRYSADTYVAGLIPLLEAAVTGLPALEAARGMARRLGTLGVAFGDDAAMRVERRRTRARFCPIES